MNIFSSVISKPSCFHHLTLLINKISSTVVVVMVVVLLLFVLCSYLLVGSPGSCILMAVVKLEI